MHVQRRKEIIFESLSWRIADANVIDRPKYSYQATAEFPAFIHSADNIQLWLTAVLALLNPSTCQCTYE